MRNIFTMPTLPLVAESVQCLFEQGKVRVERIVSTGQTTQWLDQERAEWVVLLTGGATIEYQDGRILTIGAGEYLYIPPHTVHRVAYTSTEPACIWLCFFWDAAAI